MSLITRYMLFWNFSEGVSSSTAFSSAVATSQLKRCVNSCWAYFKGWVICIQPGSCTAISSLRILCWDQLTQWLLLSWISDLPPMPISKNISSSDVEHLDMWLPKLLDWMNANISSHSATSFPREWCFTSCWPVSPSFKEPNISKCTKRTKRWVLISKMNGITW